jgi:FAD/FMN-containing dehydrogenase
MHVRLTEQAIEQCGAWIGVRNQIEFGTQIGNALAEFWAHDVSADDLRAWSKRYDIAFPWSLQYGNLRQPFNQRLIRLPLAIVFPRTVAEVVEWVNLVCEHDLSVSIRSGNNSYEGLSTLNDIVIDLTFLTIDGERQFEIDAEHATVRVASGVRLGVLYTELANAGFAFAGGQCPPVCAGGLVGTGGIGFSTRRFGWACDQLVEVECVLADGSVVTANANSYADLYQACKGAGAAGICVMTVLTLKIEPVVPILWYSVFCDATKNALESGAKVLAEWQNLVDAPKELSSSIFAAVANPAPLVSVHGWYRNETGDPDAPATLRGILDEHWLRHLPKDVDVTVTIVDLAAPKGDDIIIDPDTLDTIVRLQDTAARATFEAASVGTLLVPMPSFNRWKLKCSNTFRRLTEEELKPVFEYLIRRDELDPIGGNGVGYSSFWLLGGASNEIDPDSAVVPVREGAVMWIHYGAHWNGEEIEPAALQWIDDLADTLEPLVSNTAWYGIADLQLGSQLAEPPDLGYVKAYWQSDTHDFVPLLLEVKNQYDPLDVFQFAQSIPLSMAPDYRCRKRRKRG